MCNDYTVHADEKKLAERYQLVLPGMPQWQPRYNIKPSTKVPIVGLKKSGERSLKLAVWNFNLNKEGEWGKPVMNARSETVNTKRMFAKAFRTRRCLVPCTGFYEWHPGKQKGKSPHFFRLKDEEIFSLAGLFITDKSNDNALHCLHITCEPNELVGAVHPRMPVILRPEDEGPWMENAEDEEDVDEDFLLSLLQPYPADLMEGWQVRPLVNFPENDGPKCIEPAPDSPS